MEASSAKNQEPRREDNNKHQLLQNEEEVMAQEIAADGESSASHEGRHSKMIRTPHLMLKLLIIGDSGVGKTGILMRYSGTRDSDYVPTVGK